MRACIFLRERQNEMKHRDQLSTPERKCGTDRELQEASTNQSGAGARTKSISVHVPANNIIVNEQLSVCAPPTLWELPTYTRSQRD